MAKPKLPTHIGISASCTGIGKDSVILMEQIRTIDKSRLKEKVCHLDDKVMCEVDAALMISIGVEPTLPHQRSRCKSVNGVCSINSSCHFIEFLYV